jgi:S-DNA-T family DNA segregation ATPase FtsK/SpoIIIE
VRYVIIGLLVLSTCFAFVSAQAAFSWGGALGEYSSTWLIKWVGSFGTGAILFVAGFSYFIWRFNPSFNVPNLSFLLPKKKEEVFISEDNEEAVKQEWDLNQAAALQNAGGNKLKENKDADGNLVPTAVPDGGKLFIDELSLEEEENTNISELEPTLIEEEEIPEVAPIVEVVPSK